MLRDMMEGHVLLAPDGAEIPAGSPVDYGNGGVTSAPEMGKAVEQAGTAPAVSGEGEAPATEEGNTVATAVQTPAWMAQLPKEMRDDPELAKHRTMGEAIKYLKAEASKGNSQPESDAQAHQGGDAPEASGEQATPINYENFAGHLSENNDPFGTITEGLVSKMQELGIPQAEAENILTAIDKAQTSGLERMVQEGSKHTEAVCRKRWGKDYESNRRAMARGYQALGDSDGSLQKMLDSEGASLSPAVWELLARVGRMTAEDSASTSRAGQGEPRNPEVPVTYIY